MTNSDLVFLSASEMVQMLKKKEVSSEELVKAHLSRIDETEDNIHAFLHISESAIENARSVDKLRNENVNLPDLAGVPVAVKDVLVTKGMPSTSGSKILENYMSPFDATVVKKAKNAGMVLLGKTNMDEFAMGSSTEHSAYGNTMNPWNTERVPGGSGGGSAAAVAAAQTPLAFGSDTGGSIRQPAHFTGTVGVKPTYGAVSRYGAIALASSLDQVGPCARNVLDTAMFHDVMAGYDNYDSTSLNYQWKSMTDSARIGADMTDLKGLRIGVVKELNGQGYQKGVIDCFNNSIDILSRLGADIVEISAPHFEYAVAAYYVILPAEASSNLAKFDSVRFGLRINPDSATASDVMSRTRDVGFGAEVKRRIILGTYALSAGYYDAYYGSAQKVRTLIQNDFNSAFNKVDIILTPGAPTTAFRFGDNDDDPMAMYLNDVTTIPANLAGIPGMCLPNGLAAEDNMPVGLQLLAPAFADDRLYRYGAAIEAAHNDYFGSSLISKSPMWLAK